MKIKATTAAIAIVVLLLCGCARKDNTPNLDQVSKESLATEEAVQSKEDDQLPNPIDTTPKPPIDKAEIVVPDAIRVQNNTVLPPINVQLITDNNRSYIGTECVGRAYTIDPNEQLSSNTDNEIISIPDNGIFDEVSSTTIPSSITVVSVKDNKIPEIIITNGSMALFTQSEDNGWQCKKGDTVTIKFECYESEVSSQQPFLAGYINQGICYEGVMFKENNGAYQFPVDKDGEYYFYFFSMTSDYLSFKESNVSITHEQT